MKTLEGRVAVVTGGGSGIGRGMAKAFAASGMKVVVADIEEAAAERVAAELAGQAAEAMALRTDVAERDSVESLARRVYERFGAVHLLCNNAGVASVGTLDTVSDADWHWVLGVNLLGVVNGLQAFLPRMKAQPGEKHVVNTASMAGMQPYPILGPYVASKFAVVGLTETLRIEGAAFGLSATVLCPGNVNTAIVASGRNRPERLGGPPTDDDATGGALRAAVQREIAAGIDPLRVGHMVRDAVVRDDLYVFTHPEMRTELARRFERILAAFDRIPA